MTTRIIRCHIAPGKNAQFEGHARNWVQAISRCRADLVGCFAPREKARPPAYRISPTAYKTCRARHAADPPGRKDRSLPKLALAPHGAPA